MKKPDERPFYVYRENKGYFYGAGAGRALEGKPVNWKTSTVSAEKRDGES